MGKIEGMIRVVLVLFNTFIITCMCITQSHSVAALEVLSAKGVQESIGAEGPPRIPSQLVSISFD